MVKKPKSENVQVIVRVRPMNKKEKERGDKEVVQLDLASNTITVHGEVGGGKAFAFDAVYNNSFSQKDVYLQSIHHVVETVLQGFNATIFAYGQSGTGKTYSMAGILDDPKQLGIIPNALNHIFETIENLANDNAEYGVMASFVELYNGKCRDLLVEGRQNLELKENQQKQFYVKDLSMHSVATTMDAMRLMDIGLTRREVKSTDLNADSSRSHSLFSLYVRVHDKVNDVRTESKLNLVDLAGSERQKASGATGETLTEGNNINQSLTALGMVIDCLVKQKPHIPYRSSPLTMLLKDGLGGNSRTVIVGTCSPSSEAAHETLSSLRFLDRAKQIKNKPKVQMDPKDAKIAELQEEIKSLRARLGLGDGGDEDDAADGEAVEATKQNYIRSFDSEVEMLRRRVEELEVQAHLATEAEEAARSDLAQTEAKIAAMRADYEARQKQLEDQIRSEMEAKTLNSATESDVSDEMAELLRIVSHFIESHDESRQWKPGAAGTADRKRSRHGSQALPTVDDISAGLRMLDAAGVELKVVARRNSSMNLLTAASPPKVPAAAASAPRPQQLNPSPSAVPLVSDAASPVDPSAKDSPAMEGTKKPKKPKKKKKKRDNTEEDAEIKAGVIPGEQVEKILAAANIVQSPELSKAIDEIVEAQRELQMRSYAERLKDGDAIESPEDVSRLLAAYETLQEDLLRVRAQAAKHKEAAAKVKDIAERRAEEVEQLKKHVEALREELAAKHAQHAAEFAMQQDQLVAQQNKKVEVMMQRHNKALVKEKKQREKLSKVIEEWEEKYAKLEQDYDVKIMEYEALQQNYEAQKMEQLKKYREMAQGYSTLGGASSSSMATSVDSTNDRLRKAIAKMQAGTYLNTSYNATANDSRFTSHSAPEPSSTSLPTLPVEPPRPPPPSMNGIGPTFTRGMLDGLAPRRF